MTSSPAPANQPTPKATVPAPSATQVILQSFRDAELQPDALRGSEHLVKDLIADGTIEDLEAKRADEIDPKGKK